MPVVIVLSDLHVSAGPLDDFDAELEKHFCDFLATLGQRRTPVELVINGDFLDFVQAPRWEGADLSSTSADGLDLCFTEQQSLDKLKAIHGQHPRLFDALGEFVRARQGNTLVILPGNHDPDFFWDGVWQSFKALVCDPMKAEARRIKVHLDVVYRPDAFPSVWIEHGHQYDFLNSFVVNGRPCWSKASPPIFEDREGKRRLLECTGTRFLIRYLNRLDKDYPYVDNVKPFGRFLSIFNASVSSPKYGPGRALNALGDLLVYLINTLKRKPGDLLGLTDGTGPQARPMLVRLAQSLPPERAQDLQRRLAERGFPEFEVPLAMYVSKEVNAEKLLDFLVSHPDLCEALARGRGDELALGKGFTVDETKVLKGAARRRLTEKGVKAVVMGHTHEVVRPGELPYFNTGCWTRYYRFRDDQPIRSWKLLRDPSYELFPYQLNYLEIVPGRDVPLKMRTFHERAQ
jgi:UDP-2,3-diacylglucosamine pyrophosphatase LpxH